MKDQVEFERSIPFKDLADLEEKINRIKSFNNDYNKKIADFLLLKGCKVIPSSKENLFPIMLVDIESIISSSFKDEFIKLYNEARDEFDTACKEIGVRRWYKFKEEVQEGDAERFTISQYLNGPAIAQKPIKDASDVYPNCSRSFACGVHSYLSGDPYPQRPEEGEFIRGYYQADNDDLKTKYYKSK